MTVRARDAGGGVRRVAKLPQMNCRRLVEFLGGVAVDAGILRRRGSGQGGDGQNRNRPPYGPSGPVPCSPAHDVRLPTRADENLGSHRQSNSGVRLTSRSPPDISGKRKR